MKYLMNTYNGMAKAVIGGKNDLKDGQEVIYIIDGCEYEGVVQESFSNWSCKHSQYNEYTGKQENLVVYPEFKGTEVLFRISR